MRSAAVEVVERKTMARSPRRKGASGPECAACDGMGLKIYAGEEFLQAELCGCLPQEKKEPTPDREIYERYCLWRHWRNIPVRPDEEQARSRPGAMRSPMRGSGRPDFSESEIHQFSALAAEIDEVSSFNLDVRKIREKHESIAYKIARASIPGRYAPLLEEELPGQAVDWLDEFKKSGQATSLVLFGPTGTGKTALAAMLAVRFILETGKSVLFFPVDVIFEWRKRTITADFSNPQERAHLQQQWDQLSSSLRSVDLLILDDIGRQKPSEANETAYTTLIDLRYPSGKPTIYTTNHWTSVNSSLNGKTLVERIGPRAADRMKEATAIEVDGKSRRGEQNITREIIPKDVQESFVTEGVTKNETSCMWWLARNPVFQVVNDHERARLTNADGEDIDLAPRVYKGTWHQEDQVTVFGPVLGMDDQLLYLALIEILHDKHREIKRGISLETTIAEIREKLGLKSDSKKTTQRIFRGLGRLTRATVAYKGHDKRGWVGGLVDNFAHDGKTKDHRVFVNMNPYMIRFYDSPSFSKLRLDALREMSDWGKVFYLFVESHVDDKKHFPVETLAKIAGKSDTDRKRLKRTAQDVLKEQKALGFQTAEAHVDAKGIIHSHRSPSSIRCKTLQ